MIRTNLGSLGDRDRRASAVISVPGRGVCRGFAGERRRNDHGAAPNSSVSPPSASTPHAGDQRSDEVPLTASLSDSAQRATDAALVHRSQDRQGLPAAGELRAGWGYAAHARRREMEAEPPGGPVHPDTPAGT